MELANPLTFFAERPQPLDEVAALTHEAQAGDLLSGLLRTVRLRGDGAAHLAPSPPFAIEFGETTGIVHIFERGDCQLHIPGHATGVVREGDIVLLPRPQRHTIASGSVDEARGLERRDLVSIDSDLAGPQWLAGSFSVDAPSGGWMLAELPDAIFLTGAGTRVLTWLDVSRRLLLEEIASREQGSAAMISRILDLLFIQIVRAWANRPDADPGWMIGAMDPQIGRALTEIHAHPGRQWTVAGLAGIAHLSRSAFAKRFTERVGHAPATYVARLRLEIAAERLRTTRDPINVIGAEVGYRSNAAFTRAFSNRYGVTPKEWRIGPRPAAARLTATSPDVLASSAASAPGP
ncbi:MAG TPA: AraC family transcriptional regulator [Solirubrobacteraceae bacterium]|nr:AraC family transcriptional regulator [Solirubrobacteraceae bacterium]